MGNSEMRHAKATDAEKTKQETQFALQADKDSIERAGLLSERLMVYAQAFCKEQNLTPEELVFAAALYLVNLRETFPAGKAVFDQVSSRAAQYYDENAG